MYCPDATCAKYIPCTKHHMNGNPKFLLMSDNNFFNLHKEARKNIILLNLQTLVIHIRNIRKAKKISKVNSFEFFHAVLNAPLEISKGKENNIGPDLSLWIINQSTPVGRKFPSPQGLLTFLESLCPDFELSNLSIENLSIENYSS